MFEAPAMRERRIILGAEAVSDLGYQINRWPGPSVQFGRIFDPKLRCNAFLKSYGFPSDSYRVGFQRADARTYLLQRSINAVQPSTLAQGGSPNRGVPAVYVPTSAANSYGTMTSW